MIVVKVTTAPSPPCPPLSVVLVTAVLTVISTNNLYFIGFQKQVLALLLQIVDLLGNGNCHVNGEHEVQGVVVKVDTTDPFNELEESLSDENVYASLVRFLIGSSL